MIFTNHLSSLKVLDKEILEHFLIILNPFAPHITEELNQNFDNEPITTMNWPAFNEEYIVQEKVTIAVQFNGKTRGKLELAPGLNQEKTMEYLKSLSLEKSIYLLEKLLK